MEEITRDQKEQLTTWAAQRDVLLSEISVIRNEILNLNKTRTDLANSNTDIINQVNQSLGRLKELTEKESEYESVIDMDLANKIVEKTALENKIPELIKQVSILEAQKESLTKTIEILQSVNAGFAEKNIELEKQIGGVIELSEKNANVVNSLMESLKVSTKELIDINTKNVAETNIVLDKLPRMLVELQKHGLAIKKL